MPTGYTSQLTEKDMSFAEFVWTRARAFGALILMRDSPHDAPIPKKYEPEDYHKEEETKAREELAKLLALDTPDKQEAWGAREKAEQIVNHRKYAAKENNKKVIKKYQDTLVEVKAWNLPTKEHQGLKDFMIEQLESSIKFDDHGDYYLKRLIRRLRFRR